MMMRGHYAYCGISGNIKRLRWYFEFAFLDNSIKWLVSALDAILVVTTLGR
jgi:hypothetical protein